MGVQEEHEGLAFFEPEIARRRIALGSVQRDRRFVIESNHEAGFRERVLDEVSCVFERLGDRLITEQRRIGREALEHLGDAQTFGLPVRVEIRVRRAGRSRGLLDAGFQVEVAVTGDLTGAGDQEAGQHGTRELAAGETRNAEARREFVQQLAVVRFDVATQLDAFRRQCTGFVGAFLDTVAVTTTNHATHGVVGDEDVHEIYLP